ncbi:MAG: 3-oxoacyl-ACP reductase FabG [Planctomycetes bacterium]|nr:3-oxoacyl-ACP reductase FabG [Planctomycetota bacterium]
MDLHIKDKVALITGGSRGLGRAICIGLAAEGVKVAVNYHSSAAKAQQVVEEIKSKYKTDVIAVQADVSKSAQVQKMFEQTAETLGPLDILVNNAGIWPTAYVTDMPEEQWDSTIDINMKGPFLTCRRAVQKWLETGRTGKIVNISSQAAFYGSTTGHADYAASKAGLVTFTKSLAREVAENGIYVNAVSPGFMATDMARDEIRNNKEQYLKRIPLGRIAEPEEIANMVVFLASDRAGYITGATMDVNGGMLMR